MSFMMTGYIIFALLVLVLVNVAIRVSGKKKTERAKQQAIARSTDDEQVKTAAHETRTEKEDAPTNSREPAMVDAKQQDEHDVPIAERSKRYTNKKQQKNDADPSFDPREIKKGPLMAVMLLGAFAAILNQTLLNVAVPKIMEDFDVSASTAQWLTTAYMLVNGVLIPVTAFLMRAYPTRKIFITAMSLFAAGTILCSFSPTFFVLLLGRIIQASGAGMLMPLLMNVFLTIFPPEKRGAAMGTVGIVIMFAPAIGPTLSGWIVEHYSWRVLFYVVLPFAIVDIILAYFLLKNVLKLTFPKIDISGIILSTVAFGGILYGFSEAGNDGWSSAKVILSFVIGGIALLLFIWRELVAEEPMLELRVFKYNMFTLSSLIRLIAVMAMFSAMLLIPIYMQTIRGYTALESGLLLLPGAILMGIFQPITGILFDKIGARPLALIGLALTVWTTWELHDLSATTSFRFIMIIYALRMVGLAGVMMPIMTAGLNQLPQRLNAHGTAMANTLQQVAGSIGTAVMVSIYTAQTKTHMGTISNQMTSEHTHQQFSDLVHQLMGATGMSSDAAGAAGQQMIYGQAYKQALIEGMNDSFYVAAILAAIAFVLSLFLKRTYPPDEEQETKTR
ncbi:DHA2 family efflux MFS transporter permease subunit [Lentibacillus sp. N15]|uniref:DHA2 family efflux MFS transporter permease subunit n=1 Tax=Lentibacillus songyuanensis TaxID=3136161 RepID=UPI0031BBCD2F